MNDPMIIAAAVVLVITALSGAAVAVITAFGRMKAELLAKVMTVEAKAGEIHDLVNGSASEAAAHRKALEAEIASLHAELKLLQERRVEDAKTKAATEGR